MEFCGTSKGASKSGLVKYIFSFLINCFGHLSFTKYRSFCSMNYKTILVLLSFIPLLWADEKNYAFDAGVSLSNGMEMFAPVPSVSFYWLKSKGMHELSAEFYTASSGNQNSGTSSLSANGFGLSYAFLFKIVKYVYIGPTIGLFNYSYDKTTVTYDNFGNYLGSTNVSNDGMYYCGFKFALIFGEQTVRFKIQDRLLLGTVDYSENNGSGYGLLNTVTMSLMFAF